MVNLSWETPRRSVSVCELFSENIEHGNKRIYKLRVQKPFM